MIVNGKELLKLAPIKDMLTEKVKHNGVSHGLAEAGYDIRIRQEIEWNPPIYNVFGSMAKLPDLIVDGQIHRGNFTLASAIEEFVMPTSLVGIVHDKSTWARQGLSVFNTVIEPGFFGGLTLELVFHGSKYLYIPAGAGIAQVIFHAVSERASYNGKYNGQSTDPTPAIMK